MLTVGLKKKELTRYALVSLLSFHLRIESCDGAYITLHPSKVQAAVREVSGGEYCKLLAERSFRNATETVSCDVELYEHVRSVDFYSSDPKTPEDQELLSAPEPIEGVLYVASQAVCEIMWRHGRNDFVCPGDLLGFDTVRAKLPNGAHVPTLRCLALRKNI